MDIGECQRFTAQTDVLNPEDVALPLLGLAGEVGNLAAEYKKRQQDAVGYRAFSEEVHEELGDLLWYAAALARRCQLDLNQVMADNLRKTQERFLRPDTPPPHPLFDEGLVTPEQFPRTLDITFVESVEHDRGSAPVTVVRIYRGTDTVGDSLDDNSDDSDDYRFHDALHLGHMAVLGWSPTMRGLLKVKRTSDPDTDRIQDGGPFRSRRRRGDGLHILRRGLAQPLLEQRPSPDRRDQGLPENDCSPGSLTPIRYRLGVRHLDRVPSLSPTAGAPRRHGSREPARTLAHIHATRGLASTAHATETESPSQER